MAHMDEGKRAVMEAAVRLAAAKIIAVVIGVVIALAVAAVIFNVAMEIAILKADLQAEHEMRMEEKYDWRFRNRITRGQAFNILILTFPDQNQIKAELQALMDECSEQELDEVIAE